MAGMHGDDARHTATEIEEPSMKVRADLHCYHCGYTAGRIEGTSDTATLSAPIDDQRLVAPAQGPGFRLRPGKPPRCGRCGGPLYIDEVEIIRHVPEPIKPLPPGRRRGRPPKSLVS